MKIIIKKESVTVFDSHGNISINNSQPDFKQKIAQEAGFVSWEDLVVHVTQLNELPFTTSTEELYSQESGITCHDCKYLVREEITDTWVSVGDCNFYCDNEKATFEGHVEMLDPDCLDEYPRTCKGFAIEEIS